MATDPGGMFVVPNPKGRTIDFAIKEGYYAQVSSWEELVIKTCHRK